MDKEYLERETLLKNAKKLQGDLFGAVLIVSEIEEMPAADVKEVIHGKWVNGMKCSECGQVDWTKPRYCSNCGAIMDKDS